MSFLILIAYLLVNLEFTGPHYLSDEIGYLSKAAAIAGHSIDHPTAWDSGYSFLIAPFFYILSDPFLVWKCIIVAHALMWAVSFYWMFHILSVLFPGMSPERISVVIAICSCYPAFIIMSGYAFSTTAFVFVLSLALWSMSKCVDGAPSMGHSIISALAAGFTTWIHPTGLGVLIAYCAALIMGRGKICGTKMLPVQILIAGAVFIGYRLSVMPWIDSITSVSGVVARYPGTIASLLSRVMETPQIHERISYLLTPYVYLAVSSFGMINYFIFHCLRGMTDIWRMKIIPARTYLLAFILISFCFSYVSSVAVNFFLSSPMEVEFGNLLRGRYLEMIFLPVLCVALMNFTLDGSGIWRSFSLLAISCYSLLAPYFERFDAPGFNWINTPTYWPAVLWPASDADSVYLWTIMGVVVIGALYLLARCLSVKMAVMAVLAVYAACIVHMHDFHKRGVENYAATPELVSFIRKNFPAGSEIICDKDIPDNASASRSTRYALYVFLLFNYKFRAAPLEEWMNGEDALFLTAHPEKIDQTDNAILAMDSDYGICLVRKGSNQSFDALEYPQPSGNPRGRAFYPIPLSELDDASLESKYKFSMWHLPTLVGKLVDGSLVSTKKSGALCFGPYEPISAGEYQLTLFGKIRMVETAVVDVFSSEAGNKVLARHRLSEFDESVINESDVSSVISMLNKYEDVMTISAGNRVFTRRRSPGADWPDSPHAVSSGDIIEQFNFTVPKDLQDIQFRVFVQEGDDISIDGYSVRKAAEKQAES